MIIKLSKASVEIKDELTWGDAEAIQGSIMAGAIVKGAGKADSGFDFDPSALSAAKYVALECAVLSIDTEGAKISFSKEWMNNLSKSDGDKLYTEVDKLSKKEDGTSKK
jgi:hypothetical protein